MEAALQCEKDRKDNRENVAYHQERGGMPLHDAVVVNCRKGATTENQAQVPSIWVKGVYGLRGCMG